MFATYLRNFGSVQFSGGSRDAWVSDAIYFWKSSVSLPIAGLTAAVCQ